MRARRAVGVLLAVCLTGLSLTVAPAPTSAVPPSALAFADGSWHGTVVYSASISFGSGVSASGALDSGNFDLTVEGCTITGGTFTGTGSGQSVVPGGSATLTVDYTGAMSGSNAQPILNGQSATFSGSATVSGLTVPLNLSFGAGDFTPVPFQITSATCSLVTGRFDQTLVNAVQAQGGTVNSVIAHFTAVRTGDTPNSAESTLADLMDQAQKVSDDFAATGTLDVAGLIDVVEKSENFSASLGTSTKCGLLTNAGAFNQALTTIIADLLKLGVDHADKLSTYDLWELSAIAVEVGAIGSGAVDTTFSEQMINQLGTIFNGRLETAIAAHDTNTIMVVQFAASALGLSDLAAKAKAAL